MVVELPEQIVAKPVAVTVGGAVTFTTTCVVPEQPFVVPVIVYVVVVAGVNVSDVPLRLPGIQL
jgi:hypothetical protein